MPQAFNAVTEEINRLDIESSPIFKRLFEQAGFLLIKTGDLENFLNTEGLKLLVFADDPNERKITMDIAVIAPEIKKAFGARFLWRLGQILKKPEAWLPVGGCVHCRPWLFSAIRIS